MTTPTRPPFAPPPVAPDVTPPTPPEAPLTLRAWAQWAGMLVNTVTLVVVLVKLQTAFLSWEWSIPLWAVVAASAVGVLFFALPLVLSWHVVKYSITLMQQRLYSLGRNDTAVRRAYRDAHAPRAGKPDRIDAIPVNRGNQGSVQTTYHARVVTPEPEPAQEQATERETQRLDGPARWSAAMGKMNELRAMGVDPTWEACRGFGISRDDWKIARDEFARLGYVPDPKQGAKTRWL